MKKTDNSNQSGNQKQSEVSNTHVMKPGIISILAYVVVLLLLLLAYIFTNGYYFLACMALFLLLPAGSFLCTKKLAKNITPKLRVVPEKSVVGEQALLELQLENPLWIPALDCEWKLRIRNTFVQNLSELQVNMPVHTKQTSQICLPLHLEEMGRFTVETGEIWLRDLFGMVRWRIEQETSVSLYVAPKKENGSDMDVQEYLYGAAECEESDKKGNDCSEVSDIREYVPGDRIRDIHWKLSAKQDTLMVKERISMAGSEMVLLLHLRQDWQASKQILALAYSVVAEFMAIQIPVCILCWNQMQFSFDEYRCLSQDELKDAFYGIFELPLSERVAENLSGYLRNCYPYLNSYIDVVQKEGSVQMEMQENG